MTNDHPPHDGPPATDGTITTRDVSGKGIAIGSGAQASHEEHHHYADDKYDVRGLANPYLGLAAFTYAERAKYAGREQQVIMDPENCTVSPGVFAPTMTSKKAYSSTLKAQVVQEILREDKTLTQIASEHGIHPKVVREWKAIALRELPTLFERQTSVAALKADHERQLEDLYAEIGRLTTQLTWVKKKSGI
jgi:putative transposase